MVLPISLIDDLSWRVYGLSWNSFEALMLDALLYKLLTTTIGP